MKTSYVLPADVVNASPPTWQGQQGVSSVNTTSYSINFTMVPSSGEFYGTAGLSLYGSAVDGSGGTNYFATVVIASGGIVTVNSVPVTVTVIANPPGTPIVQPALNITVVLVYDGEGEDG